MGSSHCLVSSIYYQSIKYCYSFEYHIKDVFLYLLRIACAFQLGSVRAPNPFLFAYLLFISVHICYYRYLCNDNVYFGSMNITNGKRPNNINNVDKPFSQRIHRYGVKLLATRKVFLHACVLACRRLKLGNQLYLSYFS